MMKKILLASAAFIAAISSASAADLPIYTKAPPPPAPVLFSWTGFYFGLNAGGKWAQVDDTVTVGGTSLTFSGDTRSSWIAGGQVGYNWQAGAWVFGIEGDIDAQDFNRSRTVGTTVGPLLAGDVFSVDSNWQASLRGRIGYAGWDRTLLYITGGAAWTQITGTASLVGVGIFSSDRTVTGGTVGAGIEYAFTNNISLGVEGRWTFYGNQAFNGGTLAGVPVTNTISLDTAEVMGKINFRFF
jgi:outer membrane immunogenic protein